MITIYTIAYNEEIMIPHFIKWYKERFPSCKIIIYDNYSTDNTEKIALENGCKVIKYDTKNQLSNSKYLEIKNNCWKSADTDWVFVGDVDEMLNINELQLHQEMLKGTTIIKSKGWDVVNLKNDLDIENMDCGCNSPRYSKNYMFNKSEITEMNYEPGCHKSNPLGFVQYSEREYNLYHKRYVNAQFLIDRYREYNKRRSPEDVKYGWGIQYTSDEQKIINEIADKRKHCQKITE